MMKLYVAFSCAMLLCLGGFSQSNEAQAASYIGTVNSMRVVPSLASRESLLPAVPLTEAPQDGRSSKNAVIPGKGAQEEDDFLYKYPHQLAGKLPSKTPSLVFDVNNNVGAPSDPDLGVGPDHVVIVYNTGFIIYDKDGNDLTGPLNVNNIFSPGGCCDLTVSYDNAADRWVVCYLGNGMEIAVSDGPDPITSDWYVYHIPQIDDYNKLSVWSDGYYITQNSGGNDKVFVMERDAMLDGDAVVGIQSFNPPGLVTSGFSSCQVLNVTDDNLPNAGNATVIYLQDDAWAGVATDHVKLWSVNVDWATPTNSSISAATQITTTPFISVFDGGSFVNLAQPGGGTSIDALQATIMNQAQFRKFPGHNSALFNFVIDVDATAGELAAVRWYELRQDDDASPWSIYQEGTYSAPDGRHAWMASLAMDFQGNIGMGYTSMAGPTTPDPLTKRVSSYYTGRYASDPAGTMTLAEELISAGDANIPGTRYGDYGKIDVDPNNDKEFWFINEYMQSGGADVVGVFQIASDFTYDIGVVAMNSPQSGTLSASETVTVTIFNFGLEDVSGFNVTYQVDGGAVITEPYVGTIPSATSAEFTFSATADLSTLGQTYSFFLATDYLLDEYADNDGLDAVVTFLEPNDVGVVSIESPASSANLGSAESVTIEIENFGADTQTSIPVYFTVDGGTPVMETYTGSIATGESDTYTFTVTVDLSALGTYEITAGTELTGDSDTENDDLSESVTKFLCQPEANCSGFNDGLTVLTLADQDIFVECDGTSTGYTDNTDIIFNFVLSDNPFQGVAQVGYTNTGFAIFIDFNDDSSFSADELVAEESIASADADFNFEIDFSTITTVTSGMHLMRTRSVWELAEGDLLDPCGDAVYGRTNDFTANFSGTVGLNENAFAESDFNIAYLAGNQFLMTLSSDTYTEKLPMTITNALGETLAYYTLTNNGSGYSKNVDMSYVSAGVYFVKIGTDKLNIVKRIVVR